MRTSITNSLQELRIEWRGTYNRLSRRLRRKRKSLRTHVPIR